jgi:hypothetical protein
MWPIEDGLRVLNGVMRTVKGRGCLSQKVCLSLNGTQIMSCLC